MPSPERLTANALLAAYNTMDMTSLTSLRTPACPRIILPHSLSIPPQSNTAFLTSLTALARVFTSFSARATSVIEGTHDEGRTRVVMYVSARGETGGGGYVNEYVYNLGFTEDGGRVAEWSEFVDVGVVRDFAPLLRGEVERVGKEGREVR